VIEKIEEFILRIRYSKSPRIFISIFLFIIIITPGIYFIYLEISSDLFNLKFGEFILLLLVAPLPVIFSIIILVIIEPIVYKKILILTLPLIYYSSLLPINGYIRDLKYEDYLEKNLEFFEITTKNLIENRWDLIEANDYIFDKLKIRIDGYDKVNKIVYFYITGFIDSCSGIAFTESNHYPKTNGCGRINLWEKLNNNWYRYAAD